MSKKVTFSFSPGYVGCTRKETFTLEELGIDVNDFETEDELEAEIQEQFEQWVWDNANATWYVEGDNNEE